MTQPQLQTSRRGEQGATILLALLVFFVLVVVVWQVFFTSQVELDRASAQVMAVRTRYLAEATRLQACSVLLMDIEQADEEAADQGGAGGGAAPGGLGDLGGGGGGGSSPAEVVANTDSMLDEWANPVALAPALAEDFTIHVEVIDEDSKLNLLGLWAEDDEVRKEWRDVVERLLDKAYEGTSLDLSGSDALELIENLDEWVKGDRRIFERRDPPQLKLTDEQDEAASDVDTDIIETDEVHFPLTLGEMLLVEGLMPEHLNGFVEDDEFHPGLREYLTVWTHIELKAVQEEEDPFADSPLGAGAGDEEDAGDETVLETGHTANNGQVNANTAPLAVLRALAPDNIPTAFLERVVEFREKIHELQDEMPELDPRDEERLAEEQAEDAEAQEELDEDDPAFYVFQEPGDVFSKIEDEWDLSVFTEESEKDEFTARLCVTSDVFTIKIMVIDPESERRWTYRTIVWRIEDADTPRLVPLVPLEEFYDPRRPVDLPEDLSQQSADRFEFRRN